MSTVDKLNSFLRGELSAVETYRQAIEKLSDKAKTPREAPTLNDCMASHELRARLLAQEIRRRGGQPAQSSAAWGSFAKLVEGGAAVFGEKAAIFALEEGEDHGRNDYQRDVDKLDVDAQSWLKTEILPEQLRTHQAMSSLKKMLH